MDIGDVMSRRMVTVRPTDTVEDAVKLMLDHSISGLPVIDENANLLGIVTEGDFLRRSEIHTESPRRSRWVEVLLGPGDDAYRYIRSHGRKVAEVMTASVRTLEPEASLTEAADLMEKAHIKRIPIVRAGKLVGLVSRSDLLRAFSDAVESEEQMKSDDEVVRNTLSDGIRNQPWAPRLGINFSVEEGVVTFSGVVFDDDCRRALLVLAENVPGVKGVKDDMTLLA